MRDDLQPVSWRRVFRHRHESPWGIETSHDVTHPALQNRTASNLFDAARRFVAGVAVRKSNNKHGRTTLRLDERSEHQQRLRGGELKHWIKYVAPDGLMVEEFQSKPGGKTSRNRRSFGRTRLRMAKEASNFQSNLTNLRLFKRGKKSKEITFYAKRFMWVEPQGKKSPQTKCCQHTQLAIL